jgi:hypothetical protein
MILLMVYGSMMIMMFVDEKMIHGLVITKNLASTNNKYLTN